LQFIRNFINNANASVAHALLPWRTALPHSGHLLRASLDGSARPLS